jgi:hypothetical protein
MPINDTRHDSQFGFSRFSNLKKGIALIAAVVILQVCSVANAHDIAREMTDAANLFLKSLGEENRRKVTFEFDDPHRIDWQFVPMERPGLSFGDLKPEQLLLGTSLLQTGLSHRGYATSMQVMVLESVLHEMENLNPKRDPSKYHLFIFGQPSTEQTWGWRIEGHHLSVSFTVADGEAIASTPLFLGANPAKVPVGNLKGLRVLGQQEDLGRELVRNLSAEQKEVAVVNQNAPKDVINGPGVVAKSLQPIGLMAKDMTDDQKQRLRRLIDSFVHQIRPELAAADLKEIEDAGFDNVSFAWMGFIQPEKPHYFRVQGPTFILEYDNTQNNANHVHIVWRDFKNDFGKDLLKEHYQSHHNEETEVIDAIGR